MLPGGQTRFFSVVHFLVGTEFGITFEAYSYDYRTVKG